MKRYLATVRQYRRYTVAVIICLGILLFAIYTVEVMPAKHLAGMSERVDILSKLFTSVGVLAAGLWALFTFVLFRTAVGNLQITVSPEVIEYRGLLRLALVNVTLRNVGKVKIKAGPAGCRFSVWKLPTDCDMGKVLDLDQGVVLVEDVDLLAKYDKSFPYEIEPGNEYHESGNVIAMLGDVLGIKVAFYIGTLEDDAVTEYRFFHVA